MDDTNDPADTMESRTLSELLTKLLTLSGLSARKLASRSGGRVSANYISTLARGTDSRGKRVRPNPVYLRAIADAFAFDPLSNQVDDARSEKLYRRFMALQGYDPAVEPTGPVPATHAMTELYEFFRSNPDLTDAATDLALFTSGEPLSEEGVRAIIYTYKAVKAMENEGRQRGPQGSS